MAGVVLILGVSGLIVLVVVLLLAAAVSRRLHDSGLRAHFGLLPLPFVLYGLTAMFLLVRDFGRGDGAPNMTLFMSVFVNNMLYMVVLVTLIILLCRPSTPGPNRYGEQPV